MKERIYMMISFGEFLNSWYNHPANMGERKNLEKSDKNWEKIYEMLNNGEVLGNLKIPPQKTMLYRVHKGRCEEPVFEEELEISRGDIALAQKHYDNLYKLWVEGQNIRIDNHWLSFTKSVDTIGSNYFGGKLLRGDVIVLSSDKAIDISEEVYENLSFEKEVVAPLSELNLIEVIPFKDFIEKYGKGTSDYEKRNKK